MKKLLISGGAVLLAVVLILLGTGVLGRLRYPAPHQDLVTRESASLGLDPNLVSSLIYHESRWDPNARSSAGARGLMQLTEGTYQWLRSLAGEEEADPQRLFDPAENVHYGCALLHLLLEHYDGRVDTALAAYNAGMGNVGEWLQDPDLSEDGATLKRIPFPETERYVRAVLSGQEKYRVLYEGTGDPFGDFFRRMAAAF